MPADPAAVFSALADRNRRYVVETLARRETATATELAGDLPVTRQAVAKHLAALRAAGLVHATREGRESRYRLSPGPLSEAVAWLAAVGAEWDDRLGSLRAYVEGERAS